MDTDQQQAEAVEMALQGWHQCSACKRWYGRLTDVEGKRCFWCENDANPHRKGSRI